MQTETVKVKHKHGDGPADTHYQIINRADFDPKVHKVFGDDDKPQISASEVTDKMKEMAVEAEARRTLEANRGISGGGATVDTTRNPSGTYSEPTPTDIRYPNKDHTEFENNHGAFVNRSAAQIREEQGLPDAPGGLAPQVPVPGDWRDQSPKDKAKLASDLGLDESLKGQPLDAAIENTVVQRQAASAAGTVAPPAPGTPAAPSTTAAPATTTAAGTRSSGRTGGKAR